MIYLYLVYRDAGLWEGMGADERAALDQARLANDQELRRNGHLHAVEAPDSSGALTIQLVDGALSLGEGPARSERGALIQLYLIDARDLNEAIRLAAQLPQARAGPVELWPVRDLASKLVLDTTP